MLRAETFVLEMLKAVILHAVGLMSTPLQAAKNLTKFPCSPRAETELDLFRAKLRSMPLENSCSDSWLTMPPHSF